MKLLETYNNGHASVSTILYGDISFHTALFYELDIDLSLRIYQCVHM